MGRLLAASACAAAVLLTASACQGAADSEEPGAPGLTFLVAETAERPAAYWTEAVERVADANGLEIELTVIPLGGDPTAHVRQMLGEGAPLPDIMAGVSPKGLGTPELLYGWQPEEIARFRQPYSGSVAGQIYRLPATGEAVPVVYYNKDLLGEVPGTYAELLKTAGELKGDGVRPFALGGVEAATLLWSATITTDVYRESPTWMQHRRLDHVHFCDKEFRAAAEKVTELGEYVSITDNGGDAAFLAGEAAMYPASSRFALAAAAQPPAFEIGAFAWPTDDGGAVVPAYHGGGLSVSAAAKDLEAARRFALAFSLDPANLDHAATAEGLFPAVTEYTPPEAMGDIYRLGYELYTAAADTGALLPSVAAEDGDDGVPSATAEEWQASAARLLGGLTDAKEVCATLDGGYAPAG
ncbi:extracellular solute-binding protein [Phytomonospora sp. NPDC050363]|uniref:ABC transporter substrate-binding protein n=1 Tax=Phytomonospora sp. NPDC050363 TaxID=3155642 RepID=UPI0033E8BA61